MGFAITSAWNLATKDIQQTLDGVCKKVGALPAVHQLQAWANWHTALGAGWSSGEGLSTCSSRQPMSLRRQQRQMRAS